MRRDVLIKRVDVTVQSFSWSDRTKVSSILQFLLISLSELKN